MKKQFTKATVFTYHRMAFLLQLSHTLTKLISDRVILIFYMTITSQHLSYEHYRQTGSCVYIMVNIYLLIFSQDSKQGGHIPAKIKFPVFSLSFPCAR